MPGGCTPAREARSVPAYWTGSLRGACCALSEPQRPAVHAAITRCRMVNAVNLSRGQAQYNTGKSYATLVADEEHHRRYGRPYRPRQDGAGEGAHGDRCGPAG